MTGSTPAGDDRSPLNPPPGSHFDPGFDEEDLPPRPAPPPRVSTDPAALKEVLTIADSVFGSKAGVTPDSPHEAIVESILDRSMSGYRVLQKVLSSFVHSPSGKWGRSDSADTTPEMAANLYPMGVYAFPRDRDGRPISLRRQLLSHVGHRPDTRWGQDEEVTARSIQEIQMPRVLGGHKLEIVARYLLGAALDSSGGDLGAEVLAQRIMATYDAIPDLIKAVSSAKKAGDLFHVIKNPFVDPAVRDAVVAVLTEMTKSSWSEGPLARDYRIEGVRASAVGNLEALNVTFNERLGEVDRPTDPQVLQDSIFDQVCRAALFFSVLGRYAPDVGRPSCGTVLESIRNKVGDWIVCRDSASYVSFLIEKNLWEPGFSRAYPNVYGQNMVKALSSSPDNSASFPKEWIDPVTTRCGTLRPQFEYIQHPWGTAIVADWEEILD